MAPSRARTAALLLATASALVLAIGAPWPARGAAEVPIGKEVLVLERIPGKTGKVRFTHAEHIRRYRRPDGAPIRCRDCHHTLATDDPPVPLPPMRCSGCHAALGEPAREIDGRRARPMAALKPDGAVDHKTILFHDYCRDCHRKVPGGARKLATCKVCHERGISSESMHGRYDAVPQPGTALTWLHCPAGQRWSGTRCEGSVRLVPHGAAADACPEGYRLPTRAELLGLLDGCRPGGGGPCRSCGKSAACASLFGNDQTSTWAGAAQGGRAWVADLGDGLLRQVEVAREQAVRCVQSSEAAPEAGAPASRSKR
jgi:hypothetical protein